MRCAMCREGYFSTLEAGLLQCEDCGHIEQVAPVAFARKKLVRQQPRQSKEAEAA